MNKLSQHELKASANHIVSASGFHLPHGYTQATRMHWRPCRIGGLVELAALPNQSLPFCWFPQLDWSIPNYKRSCENCAHCLQDETWLYSCLLAHPPLVLLAITSTIPCRAFTIPSQFHTHSHAYPLYAIYRLMAIHNTTEACEPKPYLSTGGIAVYCSAHPWWVSIQSPIYSQVSSLHNQTQPP